MIMSFIEFVNEGMDTNLTFLKKLTIDLLDKLRESPKDESMEYSTFSGMEFTEPFMFDLILKVRRDSNPSLEEDSHFNDLSWEKINYDTLGYAIDANTKMSKVKELVPRITIHLILNPRKEPILYERLYARLLDILVHETNHLDQLGLNRDPFNVNVSHPDHREQSKKSYKYFILPDEVESMVEGMYAKSKEIDLPIDLVFLEYLTPFIKSEYISQSEFQKVMKVWIKRALEIYPDAKFSPAAKNIIDSI